MLPAEQAAPLKLLEKGVSKEALAGLVLLEFPCELVSAVLAGRWASSPTPFSPFMLGYKIRLVMAAAVTLVVSQHRSAFRLCELACWASSSGFFALASLKDQASHGCCYRQDDLPTLDCLSFRLPACCSQMPSNNSVLYVTGPVLSLWGVILVVASQAVSAAGSLWAFDLIHIYAHVHSNGKLFQPHQ